MKRLALLLLLLAGCDRPKLDDSAAVHIDKLRAELTEATNQRNDLKSELSLAKTRIRQLETSLAESQREIREAPGVTIGRYLSVKRRQKAGAAGDKLPDVIREMLSDFLRDARHSDRPITPNQFESFVDWMNKYDGDIPAGLVLKVSWGTDSELREKYDELLKFDQSLNDAETENQRYLLYFDREMKRLGKFADEIINPR